MDPLFSPEILEILLRNLRGNDLINARLVHPLWMDTSLKHWRKSVIFTHSGARTERAIKLGLGVEPVMGENDEASVLYKLSVKGKTFTQIRLADKKYDFPPLLTPLYDPLIINFFGERLTYLELVHPSIFYKGYIEAGLRFLLASFPSLVTLGFSPMTPTERAVISPDKMVSPKALDHHRNLRTLTIFLDEEYNNSVDYRELFFTNHESCKRFIRWLPNLSTLKLQNLRSVNSILASLKFLTIQGDRCQLHTLVLKYYPDPADDKLECLKNYLQRHQCLTSLDLDLTFRTWRTHPEFLHEIFNLLKEVITEISLKLDCIGEPSNLDPMFFPSKRFTIFNQTLHNLRKLVIKFNYQRPEKYRENNTDFVPSHYSFDFAIFCKTPALQHFQWEYRPLSFSPTLTGLIPMGFVNNDDEEDIFESDDEEESFNDNLLELDNELLLKNLQHFHYEGNLSKLEIIKLGQKFPQIQYFSSYLTNRTLQCALTAWSTLQTLKIITLRRNQIDQEKLLELRRKYQNVDIMEEQA